MSSYHTIIKILGGDNNMANERRSIGERIAELQEKQKQLKEQEKKLRAKQSQEERKKRTKRLIEIGAAVESVLNRPIEKEDLPKLVAFLKLQEQRGYYFTKAMK